MFQGEKHRRRCYFGSLKKAQERLADVSEIMPELITKEIHKEISYQLERTKKIDDERYDNLVSEILELSARLRSGWSRERHKLVREDKCPHCKKPIAIRFLRIGKDPHRSHGRYNIRDLWIEKGKTVRTRRFTSLESRYISIKKGKMNQNAANFSHTKTLKLQRK